MGFRGIYKAVYDYKPQGEGELDIKEGDILYVLEKSTEDDWWKAKKKATDDDDDEPTGLIPCNYIEEVKPVQHAKALYDYTRQTDEELSFTDGARLDIYDTSDPDWILCGLKGDYGFAPANYIELEAGGAQPVAPAAHQAYAEEEEEQAPPTPARPTAPSELEPETPSPAATPAGAMMNRQNVPPPIDTSSRSQYNGHESDEEPSPALPRRPDSYQPSLMSPVQSSPGLSPGYGQRDRNPNRQSSLRVSPPDNRVLSGDYSNSNFGYNPSQGGFHLYSVSEMVSVMGKKKKIPTTFGINLATGVITIAPEKTKDGPQQEWTAEKMTHYSIEGKHVFIELVRPTKSIDFHAGAKDTAQEIVSSLGEMAGAVRGEGIKEIYAAAAGNEKKKGEILYDFMAQGDDEVTVAVGDEVIVLDDTKSDEWWMVRRIKNGKEGVVPSSYIEITGTIAAPERQQGLNAGRSVVEQNRIEEQRLAKEALRASREPGSDHVPPRGSSLSSTPNHHERRRESRHGGSSSREKTKPNSAKVRTWTDRSKSFSVEAEFLALKDGKINLHKMNGVKIAVPVSKMSIEDLEYVERMTGVSLDEDKPLSVIQRNSLQAQTKSSPNLGQAGASIDRSPQKPEYDWFNFFLACGIAVGLCERYSQVFNRDNMDETVLPDVDATVLRTLGLREGDILKVVRHIDEKYKRNKKGDEKEEEIGEAGLFSGPGGALKNNTRKGRPAPATLTSDTVDPKAFSQQLTGGSGTKNDTEEKSPAPISKVAGGFDDDAWDVKSSKQEPPKPAGAYKPAEAPTQAPPALTGAFGDLSLLSQPLQPSKPDPPAPAPQPQLQQPATHAQPQQAQQTGATPGFFAGLPTQPSGMQPQMTGFQQQNFPQNQANLARQRPAVPQYNTGAGSLMPPPPPRPLSAPGQQAQNQFGEAPLQPQMTGLPHQPTGFQSIAPQGQSLAEMDQMHMQRQQQQQFMQMNPQMTGYQMPQPTGFQPRHTGFNQNQYPMAVSPSPFSDARAAQFSPAPTQTQQTGFQMSQPTGFGQAPFQPQATGVNVFLPPALQPQQTGMSFANGFGNAPPMPPIPQSAPALVAQKTGPPPPVRFGVQNEKKKLVSQPTGKRANLAAATPDNPFGF